MVLDGIGCFRFGGHDPRVGFLVSWLIGFVVVGFLVLVIQSFKYHDPLGGYPDLAEKQGC